MNMNDIQMLVNIVGMTMELLESGKLVYVVRCKYCKHWDPDTHECDIKTGWFACSEDWFCADGDRREGG